MSDIEEITTFTDALIDVSSEIGIGLTVVDMRKLSEALIKRGIGSKYKAAEDVCSHLKEKLIDRETKYSMGNKYLSEYNTGYLEALADMQTYVDVLLGEKD